MKLLMFVVASADFQPQNRENSLFFRVSRTLTAKDWLARDCLRHQFQVYTTEITKDA